MKRVLRGNFIAPSAFINKVEIRKKVNKMAKNETVKITLKKSIIGSPEKHTRIVKALGLTKTNQVVEHNKTDIIMGMVKEKRIFDIAV